MKPFNRTIVPVMLCVVLGLWIGGVMSNPSAEAQTSAPASATRFQISSFASPVGNSVSHGAYVIDTMSGKVWQVRAGGKPEVIADKLQ